MLIEEISNVGIHDYQCYGYYGRVDKIEMEFPRVLRPRL